MIPQYGRYICILALVCIWLPLIGNISGWTANNFSAEQRVGAAFPEWPTSAVGWARLPRKLGAYAKDNFGFRNEMVWTYSRLRYLARSPANKQVTFGRGGWLYYTQDDVFEQSRGQIYRASRVSNFIDLTVKMNDLVAAAGGRMVVAIPPNRHSVATEHLPLWSLRFDGPTEYDAILEMLARRGVAAIDLRPVLKEGKVVGPVYRTRDTHWTTLGALLAFNAIGLELDRPEWVIDPADVFRGTRTNHGDLAGMIGVSDIAPNIDTSLDLSNYRPDRADTTNLDDFPPQPSYIVDTSNGGETILVIGDSFSGGIMKGYLTTRAGRFVWTHFRSCGFNWSLIEKNLPATLILMPVERYALCTEGVKPTDFPAGRVER